MTENTYTIESAAVSDKGLSEKRPQNEDSFLKMDARGLFVVADGVGGAQAGEVASQMAVEILGEAFNNLKAGGDAEEMMRVAVERANEAIYRMSHDLAQLSTMATTIVALHVAGDIATIGHVGDSRIYRLDSRGNLYRETQDHSMVEEEVRAGRMTEAQAANHPSRNIISRALGADAGVEVDMKTIMFEPRDTTFLLCSDGITRHIPDDEIRRLLSGGDAPETICQKMKQICYERGAEDNLTAVIVKSSGATAAKSAGRDDYEESTVATARQSAAAASRFEDTAPITESRPPNHAPPERLIVETAPAKSIETVRTLEREDAGSGRKAGKILSALLWLIVGGLAGAGVYYLFERNNPPTAQPPVLVPQSENINLTEFEKLRRAVDRDPQGYLASVANTPPEDAEDFYLLGRANLYAGRFPEAKQLFTQARDRLAQTNEANAKVLAHDIETGLIIVSVPFAQEEFKKSLNLN